MATYTLNSAIYAAQTSQPPRLPDGFLLGRSLRRAKVDYTLTAAFSGTSGTDYNFVNLEILPPGAKLIPHLCRVSHQGAASTLTVSLVDSAGTALSTTVDALTANGISFAKEDLEVGLQDDGIVQLKINTHAASAAADVIQVELVFVVPAES